MLPFNIHHKNICACVEWQHCADQLKSYFEPFEPDFRVILLRNNILKLAVYLHTRGYFMLTNTSRGPMPSDVPTSAFYNPRDKLPKYAWTHGHVKLTINRTKTQKYGCTRTHILTHTYSHKLSHTHEHARERDNSTIRSVPVVTAACNVINDSIQKDVNIIILRIWAIINQLQIRQEIALFTYSILCVLAL